MGSKIALFFIIILFSFFQGASAQTDTLKKPVVKGSPFPARVILRDSAALARYKARQDSIQAYKDSLTAVNDSLAKIWIGKPDPRRPNRFLDSLFEHYRVKNLDFQAWAEKFPRKESRYDLGKPRQKGESWLFYYVLALLLFFAVLKRAFSKELYLIVQSLYSNRTLNQVSKEENLFTSWPFVFLYILFGFTIGTFLYLCARYFQLNYSITGFQLLLSLSVLVIGLFTLKVFVLKLLGFVFNLQKLINNYISILYLSYFYAAILFLPLVIAFCLTPLRSSEVYIYLALLLAGCILLLQFLRAGSLILSEYKFPIVYLVLYICALEICPLIILFKALRF